MQGLKVIFRKELADHFSSYRFLVLFALIWMVSLVTTYVVGMSIRQELQGIAKPKFVFLLLFTAQGGLFSLVQFIAFFGPLIGLILGFDMINREKNEGTLSRLLSQPIYRDAVINGKFLAGVVTITVMVTAIILVITGLGLNLLGVVPGPEEIGRILIYLLVSVIYISFWLGVAILFSILFRSVTTSALAALTTWIFFSFFLTLGASIVARAVTPGAGPDNPEALIKQVNIHRTLSLASPMVLYSEATSVIIDPTRRTTRSLIIVGPLEKFSQERFTGPLPLKESTLLVMPYLVCLVAITALCFAISYLVFMKQEIRSG